MTSDRAFSLKGRRVWVAGHRGMVGSAIVRRLADEDCEIPTVDREVLDLRRFEPVLAWLEEQRPHAVFLAAARVGGIHANETYPADFLHDNLMIGANVIEAARLTGVAKLIFLGSSCIYPRLSPQPIPEDALLTGPLEPTNEGYAIAKIAGLKMVQAYRRQHGCDFITAMPTNLYGPGDNFDLATSHVLPALIRKAHEAKLGVARNMSVWGSGAARREFLHVDDCAAALVFLMKSYSDALHVNVGCGEDLAIGDLARMVADVVGFQGDLVFDASKPDGTPRKLLDITLLTSLGWASKIPLREGLEATYDWYSREAGTLRGVV